MLTSAARVIRFALQNFWRDVWLSTVTIVIFVLAITLVGVLSGVRVVTDQAIGVLQSKVDVTVSFKAGTPDTLAQELQATLETLPETTSVEFLSAEENFDRFKEMHADDPVISQGASVVGTNPFGPSLVIQARSLDEYPKIAAVLEDDAYTDAIESGANTLESNQAAIQNLSNFTRNVDRFSLALTLIFSVIAILVVVNTIRIAIYTHREEIGIMKLVGASNWFVRAPFLVESVLIGLIAIVLASLVLLASISLLSGWFDNLFRGYEIDMSAYFLNNFLKIFWGPLVGAMLISILSAGIAVGRYVRV